jgi:hypothetical protein
VGLNVAQARSRSGNASCSIRVAGASTSARQGCNRPPPPLPPPPAPRHYRRWYSRASAFLSASSASMWRKAGTLAPMRQAREPVAQPCLCVIHSVEAPRPRARRCAMRTTRRIILCARSCRRRTGATTRTRPRTTQTCVPSSQGHPVYPVASLMCEMPWNAWT